MNVLRARSAGFCMGVSRALQCLDNALLIKGVTLVMLGPIIHNAQVIAAYTAQGVITLDTVDDVLAMQAQSALPLHVIIRAHGIPVSDEERLRICGVVIIDATCPRVKDAQLSIATATKDGLPLVLFGESTHPEVLGLQSYAQGSCDVFESFGDVRQLVSKFQNFVVLAAQTTQEIAQFKEFIAIFTERVKDVCVLNTICHATAMRQQEAIEIAGQVEGMVVVGGKSSGNTRRLVDVALSYSIPAWHVETLDELICSTEFLQMKGKISDMGLTAGASTPKSLIDEVASYLMAL